MGRFTDVFRKNLSHDQDRFTRSKDYRKQYLKKHKGFFGIYTCSYCGKLISKNNMQVDHIYPVNGVSGGVFDNMSGKMFISVMSALHGPKALKEGVNADWNKTSACLYCNGKKTDLKGAWVIRGYVGKIVFPILNFVLIVGLCYGTITSLTVDNQSLLYKWVFIFCLVKTILYLISHK